MCALAQRRVHVERVVEDGRVDRARRRAVRRGGGGIAPYRACGRLGPAGRIARRRRRRRRSSTAVIATTAAASIPELGTARRGKDDARFGVGRELALPRILHTRKLALLGSRLAAQREVAHLRAAVVRVPGLA